MGDTIDIRLFKENDLYLASLCLILLYIIAYGARKKYRNTPIQKYFFPALTLRFLFVIVYALVIQFYYGFGDTITFYRALQDMHNAVANDLSFVGHILNSTRTNISDPLYPYFAYDGSGITHYYMANPSNYAVPKFGLAFSLLFFKSYLCISFCICLFSFAGCWRIFKMFYSMYPQLKFKFAISILFLPSVLFWGGSFLKDSICMGALGFMLYSLYSIFIKRRKVGVSLIIVLFMAYLLFYIKVYILISVVAAFMLWVFLNFQKRIRNFSVRAFSIFFVGIITMAGVVFFIAKITASEVGAQYSSDRILETVQSLQTNTTSSEGSNFDIGRVDNSFGGVIRLLPMGIIVTLFRPFLWEVYNPLMLMSSLEALGFLILTIMAFRRIGIRRFFSLAVSDPVIIFCMVYSILFAALIGISTNNFGALVRYKIPCISFYLFMLFIIMDKSGKFSPKIVFHKKFF